MHEVDVKEVRFVEGNGMLVKKVKCNFRTMGKKFGKLMKGIAAYMNNISQEEIATLENTGALTLNIEGQEVVVDKEDVEIFSDDIPGWLVANEGNLTVALEIELTDELRNEGMARELINRIQKIRKETGLEITDRIKVTVAPKYQGTRGLSPVRILRGSSFGKRASWHSPRTGKKHQGLLQSLQDDERISSAS